MIRLFSRARITIAWGCSACVSVGTIESRAGTPIFQVLKELIAAHDHENPECGANRRLRFATTVELGRHAYGAHTNRHGEEAI